MALAPERRRTDRIAAFGLLIIGMILGFRRRGRDDERSKTEKTRSHRRYYYDDESVRDALARFEEHFGMLSAEFYELYRRDGLSEHLPRRQANAWAALVEEAEELERDRADLAAQVDEALALS